LAEAQLSNNAKLLTQMYTSLTRVAALQQVSFSFSWTADRS
jgi:hypothetical protein